ncbi:50S ribosomal protein L16 [Candidatus Woesearchaeota archaeon]|nr:50S ribosomal protein L16 [Candidatus Woesearchaeota archaeon]
MPRLRKFTAYRNVKRPYTRISKFKSKSFIKTSPNIHVVTFEMGNQKKQFSHALFLNATTELQIRDNAFESARETANRVLEKTLGVNGFRMQIAVYPHHILREHSLAAGAGADRFSSGMAHPFGKPIGSAAQIRKGQTLFRAWVDKENIAVAQKALHRAGTKLPCTCSIVITENIPG